jgi:predicted enzyme related to lactoylglutathione lyase
VLNTHDVSDDVVSPDPGLVCSKTGNDIADQVAGKVQKVTTWSSIQYDKEGRAVKPGVSLMTGEAKGRALGVGGVFFRSADPASLASWYQQALGLEIESWGVTNGTSFHPDAMPANAFTVWGAFAADTEYFGDRRQSFMINLVVDDLDLALANVLAAGGEVIPDKEEHDFGRFGWIVDPDGNRVELWEPPNKMPEADQ